MPRSPFLYLGQFLARRRTVTRKVAAWASRNSKPVIILPIGDENASTTVPYVTYSLIALNVGVYSYMLSLDPEQTENFVRHWASIPSHFNLLTAFTSTFLHGGFGHILGNMVFLWIYGDNVEDKLGKLGYLVFYLSTGVFASFCHAHAVPLAYADTSSLGASGAISAVLGAYAVFSPWAKIKYWCCIWFILFFYQRVFHVWSWVTIGFWIVGQTMAQMAATSSGSMDGVAYAAHVGGFVAGAAVALSLVFLGVIRPEWDSLRRPPGYREAFVPPPIARAVVTHPCPACREALHPLPLPNLNLDECRACGGLWCDRGELETLLRLPRLPNAVLYTPAQQPRLRHVPAGERLCPRCQVVLTPGVVGSRELDVCPGCQGAFLDKGELGALHG